MIPAVARTRPFVLAVLGAVVLVAISCPVSRAQSGRGRGRPVPPPSETANFPAQEQSGFEVRGVMQAIARGEGRQVLAHYESVAAEAEQQGDRARSARARVAVGVAAFRLGRYQKAIQVCRQALEMFKTLDVPANLLIVTTGYTHLASAHQQVGDLAQARAVVEEGLALVEGSGRSGRGADMA